MTTDDKNVLILFSGGIDSTACIHYYLKLDFNVEGIFVDYGQKAHIREFSSVTNIASYYGIKVNRITCNIPYNVTTGEIIGRNGFLIMAALLGNSNFRGIISLGIHSDVSYYDCSNFFVQNMNDILNGYTDGQIMLDIPFLNWNKKMIYGYCKDMNVPINLTYSCESDGDEACGVCQSCLDRGALC